MSTLRLSYLQKVGGYLYRPPPPPTQKSGGGGGGYIPHPPGIYASAHFQLVMHIS